MNQRRITSHELLPMQCNLGQAGCFPEQETKFLFLFVSVCLTLQQWWHTRPIPLTNFHDWQ